MAKPHNQSIVVFLDGQQYEVTAGLSVAGFLLENGIRSWRSTRVHGKQRGLYCGIGACFDCLITVDSQPFQRACMVQLAEGMRIETHQTGEGSE
ncbi:(2Fe-2S)-binding protein [Corynebacterium freiburgense]|uniref:(2Fe-2S)-binding protein n=1 Tax=Corynebacterium freiburgense TaxID=556548 RepID=UPI000417CCA3|nr:(2Fe-2S)-binding protein [Corynebacterium freiburgense]WJZ02617.1 Hydrogen cyanide synthase subunit HcnA [Corynebacterium freiburgense]